MPTLRCDVWQVQRVWLLFTGESSTRRRRMSKRKMVMSEKTQKILNNSLIIFGSVLVVGALMIQFRKKDTLFVQEVSREEQMA